MGKQERTYNLMGALAALMDRAPMLRVLLAIGAGIVVGERLPRALLLPLCAGEVVLFVLMALSTRWRRKRAFLPLLWFFLVFFGMLLAAVYRTDSSSGLPSGGWCVDEGQPATFVVRLSDTPRQTPKTYKVKARVVSVMDSDTWQPAKCDIMLYVKKDSASAALGYGDCLVVHAYPQLPDSSVGSGQFDYRRYLQHHGIGWQCYAPSWGWEKIESHSDGHLGLIGWSKRLQQRMVRRIQSCSLTRQQQGIAEALLLGWRDDLDESTLEQFRSAGVVHLLCVSGLHVGIVAWLAGLLFFFFGKRLWQRIVKGVVQIAVIWFFVMLTGMAPSTLRAGVMFSLFTVGGMLQRQPSTLNNLCTSAVILLMVNPYLLFDVGFQLSYSAVLGIIAWNEPLQKFLPIARQGIPRRLLVAVWELICLSTAAQMGVMPVMLYHFHQFAPWFLIANLLIVPFAGLLLATVLCVVLLSPTSLLGLWTTELLRLELVATDAVTRWVSSLPCAMLEGFYFNLPMALLLTAVLLAATFFVRRRPLQR
ncbi:MAG: ComEC family competence protein [Bacteroidales bacterium]|nr:ComEC family competence protein [Bacteroidales bacterium]